MNPNNDEVRCKRCGVLLAKIDETGLTILRGDLQATINGIFRATLVCYTPHCRTLNILRYPNKQQRNKAPTA